jgi:uncharacterized protein YbaA (DUF1428 family)
MKDPSMKDMEKIMKKMGDIMDMKRFAHGGFKTMISW